MASGKNQNIPPTQGTVNGATIIATNQGRNPAYCVVTNPHASTNLFLGGADVSSTTYGLVVATSSGTQSFYLAADDKIYAYTAGRALPTTTGTATTNVFASTSHGMAVGDAVVFTALTGGTGLAINTIYYVIADTFASGTFKVSDAVGGTEKDFTSNVTACTVYTGNTPRVFISGGY